MQVVALLSWILAFAPGAAPPTAGAAERSGPEAEPVRDPAALFASGQAKYETHDYAGAIADFTAAYDLALEIADADLRDEARARLAFNLARAHVSAHDVDGERSHLQIARRLIADFRGHERAQGRDPDADTDLQRLELDLSSREHELAEAEAREHPEHYALPVGESAAARRARTRRRAGIATLSLSPAFAGLAIAGGVIASQAASEFETVTTGEARLDAQRRGRTGDILLGVGIGLAAASALTGVTLVVLARRDAPARLALGLRPTGLLVQGSF